MWWLTEIRLTRLSQGEWCSMLDGRRSRIKAVSEAIDLDRPETYARLDPDDMYRRVTDLPKQIEDAWTSSASLSIPEDYRSARTVLVAGMGGSAIGGSLLQSYGFDQLPVPVQVWRNYGLPAWVNEHTLLIAVSYSGDTEETVSALAEGQRRGAKIIAITTGGAVAAAAGARGIPTFRFSYSAPPRATIGYLFTPLIRIFAMLGFLSDQEQ